MDKKIIKKSTKKTPSLVYKQEGELVPFNGWPPAMAVNKLAPKYFKYDFGRVDVYCLKHYAKMYWQKDFMDRLAEWVYKRYSSPIKFNKLFNLFLEKAKSLEKIYKTAKPAEILNYTNSELKKFFDKIWVAYKEFWAYGLFIDAFDAGFDQEEIKKIIKKYNLTIKEASVLNTPPEMSFTSEREYSLLKIIRNLPKPPKKNFDKFLADYVKNSPEVKKYILNFDYYKSNYAKVEHIIEREIIREIKQYLKDKKSLENKYNKLHNYTKIQTSEIKRIIKKHNLKENPLFFFNQLTYWRECRKQINLMGIHVLNMILDAIERKTKIPKNYLKYLNYDEIDKVLKGSIGLAVLKKRFEKGVLISVFGRGYNLAIGEQAIIFKNKLDKRLANKISGNIIVGQTACHGYAKGRAKIILYKNDFNKFKEGEILVTGMTRPEYLPVMKKAAAIVTNEGGITSHAAIISRELNKPCIIGTQNATQLIKNGDWVEVDANKGVVKIIK